jgi:hypothetical protein
MTDEKHGSLISTITNLFTTNPAGATNLLNVLGHQNGKAAVTVASLLSMATPANIAEVAGQIAQVPGVAALNVLPQIELLVGVTDQTQFTKGVLAVDQTLSASQTSGLGGVVSGLFGKKKPH